MYGQSCKAQEEQISSFMSTGTVGHCCRTVFAGQDSPSLGTPFTGFHPPTPGLQPCLATACSQHIVFTLAKAQIQNSKHPRTPPTGNVHMLYFTQEGQISSFMSTDTVLQDIGFERNPNKITSGLQLHSHSSRHKKTARQQHGNKQLGTKWGEKKCES